MPRLDMDKHLTNSRARLTAVGFDDSPAEGHDVPDPAEVALARAFLGWNCRPTKTIRGRLYTSYGLKSLAERWVRSRGLGRAYISNGALIAAALEKGYRVKRLGRNSPNAVFNLAIVRGARRELERAGLL